MAVLGLWPMAMNTPERSMSVASSAGPSFLGGVLLLYGARMAGGCTSGHGISGGLQLAVSSYLFMAAMFAAGIATAIPLLRPRHKA
jgi:uncharacterized membrane protein YedE/YeeE